MLIRPNIRNSLNTVLFFFQSRYTKMVLNIMFFHTVTVTPTCEDTVLSLDNSIQSPNFPYKYNPNETCTWAVIALSGRQLQIKFKDFRLEPSKDNLLIYDGSSNNSAIIQRLTGTSLPSDVISTGNSLFLVFISDDNIYYNGFNLQYFIKGTLIHITLRWLT